MIGTDKAGIFTSLHIASLQLFKTKAIKQTMSDLHCHKLKGTQQEKLATSITLM